MEPMFLLLYLLAGVCFGLAAGSVTRGRVNFVGLGLLFWVVVEVVQSAMKL